MYQLKIWEQEKNKKIDITSSSGLSDAEIEKMQQEAKAHEAEDEKRKESVTARNNADSLIYQAEKTVKELGDKADPEKSERNQCRC